MKCPKCGLTQPDNSQECLRCGVVFAKIGFAPQPSATPVQPAIPRGETETRHSPPKSRGIGPTPVPKEKVFEPTGDERPLHEIRLKQSNTGAGETNRNAQVQTDPALADVDLVADDGLSATAYIEDETDFEPEVRTLDKQDRLVLVSGPIVALVIMFFPFISHFFSTLGVLVHEMGHAIVGWLFGYPSVPAFDLHYGGGVTLHLDRSIPLLVVFYALMAAAMYLYRKNIPTLILLGVLLTVHIIISLTSLRHIVILFMGHGMELIIAGVFFYRALSVAAVVHSAERPLYCIIAFFLVFWDVRFAFRLMISAEERTMYEEAKGGGHWMDFSRIAEDHLHVDLKVVALFFFLCCFVPLVVGFLCFRYQEYLRRWVTRRAVRHPAASLMNSGISGSRCSRQRQTNTTPSCPPRDSTANRSRNVPPDPDC